MIFFYLVRININKWNNNNNNSNNNSNYSNKGILYLLHWVMAADSLLFSFVRSIYIADNENEFHPHDFGKGWALTGREKVKCMDKIPLHY